MSTNYVRYRKYEDGSIYREDSFPNLNMYYQEVLIDECAIPFYTADAQEQWDEVCTAVEEQLELRKRMLKPVFRKQV